MLHYEGDNFGSIASLDIAGFSDFQSFNPATFKNGKKWTAVPFKEQTGILSIKSEETPNGPLYSYSGNFYIHNLRDQVDNALQPLIGTKSVMRITDLNGRIYVIGSPENPVTLNSNGSTGQRYTDENGQEFQFKVEQINPALRA